MEICKILTGEERLNLKTFFQLSQPAIKFELGTAAAWFVDMWEWIGDVIPCHIVATRYSAFH